MKRKLPELTIMMMEPTQIKENAMNENQGKTELGKLVESALTGFVRSGLIKKEDYDRIMGVASDSYTPIKTMTIREVAQTAKVTEPTVRKWVREGILTAIRVPNTRMIRFRETDVRELLDRH
jgi:excisionase family DNA binding protein